MTPPPFEQIRIIGIVGAGAIGAGWAAHFLGKGLDVIAYDPMPDADRHIRKLVDRAWPTVEAHGLCDGADRARLRCVGTIAAAVAEADFVQESVPERHDLKREVIGEISRHARPDVVIASSTSHITVTEFQRDAHLPERVVLGHPCHPVYLLPFVEVCGGAMTDPGVVDWMHGFYRHRGHQPIIVRKDIQGYVVNRLQRALYAEAMRLYVDGVASTAEIDAGLHLGVGLRSALFGPFFARAIAAGESDPRKLYRWQRDNKITYPFEEGYPELSDSLIDTVVAEAEEQMAGHSVEELEAKRDAIIVGILALRKELGWPLESI